MRYLLLFGFVALLGADAFAGGMILGGSGAVPACTNMVATSASVNDSVTTTAPSANTAVITTCG